MPLVFCPTCHEVVGDNPEACRRCEDVWTQEQLDRARAKGALLAAELREMADD